MDKYLKLVDWERLEKTLNYKIKDQSLFLKALTHRSYLNENKEYPNPSNERLEFLGDAILQFLISEELFSKYPNQPEGKLTNYRSALVNTVSLGEESLRMQVGQFLLMSVGEEQTGGRTREYILANTFEAILGAIYLDCKDLDICRKHLKTNLFYKIDKIVQNNAYKDTKSHLQEITQEKFNITPIYKVLKEDGPDHDKIFVVGVYLNKDLKGQGTGPSKQRAEQSAAGDAINNLEK